jgi:hypothetical protein
MKKSYKLQVANRKLQVTCHELPADRQNYIISYKLQVGSSNRLAG